MLETVPEAADQVTEVLKLPVPTTLAEHWLVWPVVRSDGEHVTLTDVTEEAAEAGVLLVTKLPPLHPAIHTMPEKSRQNSATRFMVYPPFI